MPSRRQFVAAAAIAGLAWAARAQPTTGAPRRLGILASGLRPLEIRVWEPMLKALARLGYIEGSSLAVEWRFAENELERLPQLAADLARAKLGAVVAVGNEATWALQRAMGTVPIVTGGVSDPVLGGFAKGLARPGGTVTGLSFGLSEIAQLQLSLLRSLVPKLARVAVVHAGDGHPDAEGVQAIVNAAKILRLAAHPVAVNDVPALEGALKKMPGSGAAAVFMSPGGRLPEGALAEAAIRLRVPTMFSERRWVSAGGLMCYSMYHEDRMGRMAALLDKVFRGASPADIPFELPTNSLLAINRSTAMSLGITIPGEVLVRADEVIE